MAKIFKKFLKFFFEKIYSFLSTFWRNLKYQKIISKIFLIVKTFFEIFLKSFFAAKFKRSNYYIKKFFHCQIFFRLFLKMIFFDSQKSGKSFIFRDPQKIIFTKNFSEIKKKILEIENEIARGNWAAGFFSYEAGFFFEKYFREKILKNEKIAEKNFKNATEKFLKNSNFPFLKFGIFAPPQVFRGPIPKKILQKNGENFAIKNFSTAENFEKYEKKFRKIREKILAGDFFQINLATKIFFDFFGSVENFFLFLRQQQKVDFAAFLDFGDQKICSQSPELFLKIRDQKIFFAPMKGTAKIDKIKNLLSEKNRAENEMIVDLLRNDAGKIAEKISVDQLFAIEKFDTLAQMSSKISGKLKKNISIFEILAAIFPCGSVTGAPKIRAMREIAALENFPRQIFCGAIGFFSKNFSEFSVPIRTILIENCRAEMGVGSGIVADSRAKSEWDEIFLKTKFLEKIFKIKK